MLLLSVTSVQAELERGECERSQLSSRYGKKKSRREGKREKKMTLSCESCFPTDGCAFFSMPYKHVNFCRRGFGEHRKWSFKWDVSALWRQGGVPNLEGAIRARSAEDFLGCRHALGRCWTPSTCMLDAVLVVLTTNIWRGLVGISKR